MFKKYAAGASIVVLLALLLGACVLPNSNPPDSAQFSIVCGSNTLSISYTAGGVLDPEAVPGYYAMVSVGDMSSPDVVGFAGIIPPEILDVIGGEFPPGLTIPEMPSEPKGQRYTINVPIMGPNGSFLSDPWPNSTLYTVSIVYEIPESGVPGIAMFPNIACGVPVTVNPVAPQWWNPGDGRINRDPGALGVIYAVSYGVRGMGLHIYKVGADSSGALWLEVTPEMLATVPAFPSDYTIIARSEDGYIELAKLPTGQYQVNTGPDSEGKIYVVVFDEIRTGSPWIFFTVSIYD